MDIAAFMLAFMPVAFGVAYGRGASSLFPMATNHYSTLALPILYWSFLSWCLGTPRLPAKFIQAVLCAVVAVFWIMYADDAVHYGRRRLLRTAEIERELKSGVATDVIVNRHIRDLYYTDELWSRKLVKDGIDDFRNAGFAQYGPAAQNRH
jgi:hypothetical protein